MSYEPAKRIFYLVLLLFGVFAGSTAVVLIKLSEVHPTVLSAWRLLIAATALSPFFIIAWRRTDHHFGWRTIKPSLLPAVLLALHFISWAAGARMTLAANGTLIVNMVPIVMPFFLFLFLREKINRIEVAGTLLALVRIFILTLGNYRIEPGNLLGDLVCFGSMLLFALYLVCGRANRGMGSLWLYIVPLYAIAGVICLILALPFANPFAILPGREILLLAGLGLIPTVMGHSLLNLSLKHFGGQTVSVCNLGQFAFAGVLAFLIFAELPHPPFYLAVVLVVSGAWIVVRAMPPSDPVPIRAPIVQREPE